jgi:two-component system chemotaxis sensor kinase CheA
VRIAASKLDSLMRQTEELLAIKLTLAQRAVELREIQEFVNEYSRSVTKAQRESRSRRPRERREDEASSLAEFSEQSRVVTRTLDTKLNTLRRAAEHDRRSVGGMIDNLMEDIKKVLMLPVASLLDVLPKMVRDLARSQSKEVQLEIHGGDIEVDRRILEEMKDPLVHLLRNSVDHALEEPAERERSGKLRQGTIAIHVAPRDGSNVEIIIADDGRGIDIAHVKSAAIRLGHITEEQAAEMPDSEVIMLIFQSELSTSSIITDLSGRGLGMAIVREKVEKLGGSIAVETQRGVGTIFRITLPLTLATFRGVLVTAGGSPFVIPTVSIERVVRIASEEVKSVCGRRTVVIEDQTVSLVHLSTVLEMPPVQIPLPTC